MRHDCFEKKPNIILFRILKFTRCHVKNKHVKARDREMTQESIKTIREITVACTKGISDEDGEKQSASGYILKALRFVERLEVTREREETVSNDR